jgi:hypothetical protein
MVGDRWVDRGISLYFRRLEFFKVTETTVEADIEDCNNEEGQER